MSKGSDQFREGQYVVYTNGYKYEIMKEKPEH